MSHMRRLWPDDLEGASPGVYDQQQILPDWCLLENEITNTPLGFKPYIYGVPSGD